MSKVIQNVVLLMDPPNDAWCISLKGGNMALNRFCVDEETAFESYGIFYLQRYSYSSDLKKGKRRIYCYRLWLCFINKFSKSLP